MNPSIYFAIYFRSAFAIGSLLFFGAISMSLMPDQPYWTSFSVGALGGLAFAGFLFTLSHFLKNVNIQKLNVAALGLFFGWFLGFSIDQVFSAIIGIVPQLFSYETLFIIKSCIYLTSCYFGLTLTFLSSEELNFCIPFLRFNPLDRKKNDILLDPSLLTDSRLFDLARSGLLDHQLLVPYFCLEDLRCLADSGEESVRSKAQSGLEAFKRLEALLGLDLRIVHHDYPECKDVYTKLIRLARKLNANILTADINKIQQFELNESKVININLLSASSKPLAATGEHIQIKIQRFGKEPRQGVGYLDDGTMVVVNGGAEYIGKTIKVVVLSIKPTSSGRMIFCNTLDIPSDCNGIEGLDAPHCESGSSSYYHA